MEIMYSKLSDKFFLMHRRVETYFCGHTFTDESVHLFVSVFWVDWPSVKNSVVPVYQFCPFCVSLQET